MDTKIDYAKHTESELVDMFGRLDPRYAPEECARLAAFLNERGFMVTPGTTGPGSAVPRIFARGFRNEHDRHPPFR